ncbi:MAG: hypothetical protein HYR51_14260 [Candidatus Rokubacteria bacterium]|nr:hypothetical protein [Candidatus Rokubacteria bacterium]
MGIDDIKRITAPSTRNGREWQVQLSAAPLREWLEIFKRSGESSVTNLQRVVFDRDTAFFTGGAEHVEDWIRAIDKGIAATNERYAASLDQASRARATRETAETVEKERIRELNERFKNL